MLRDPGAASLDDAIFRVSGIFSVWPKNIIAAPESLWMSEGLNRSQVWLALGKCKYVYTFLLS